MNKPRRAARQILAARLREERGRHFKTAVDAARAMRLEPTGYTHHENGRRGISGERAQLYGRQFKVNPAYFLVLSALRDADGGNSQTTVNVPTIGEAAIGVWRESVENMSQNMENLSVPAQVDWHPGEGEYALQLRDDSLNLVALPGEYLICDPIRSGPIDSSQFHVGDFLHVERVKRSGLKETSFRRVSAINGAELKLSSYSSNRRYRGTLTYPAREGSSESVVIKGIVVAKHAFMRSRASSRR